MFRITMFIIGFFITSYSLSFLALYLNLLTNGYSFLYYLKYITNHSELYFLISGILLIILSIEWNNILKRVRLSN